MVTTWSFHRPKNYAEYENRSTPNGNGIVSDKLSGRANGLMKEHTEDHYKQADSCYERAPGSVRHVNAVVIQRFLLGMFVARTVVVFPSLIPGFDDWSTRKIVLFNG